MARKPSDYPAETARDCIPACLGVMLASLLCYYPLEHFMPEWLHALSGVALLGSIGVFLTWCGGSCIAERRRRA